MQTPQREWLRGPLQEWVRDRTETALENVGGTWLDADRVRKELATFIDGQGDNSFFVWQWLSVSWLLEQTQVCLR
jgi:asparagine synthase (glutamine-hydrolysing)